MIVESCPGMQSQDSPTTDELDLSAKSQMVWFLNGGDSVGNPARRFAVNANPHIIGRRADLNLSLDSRSVSGIHAEIIQRADRIYLRDLTSTNGTFVNGERILGEIELHDGDLIQFADLVFRLTRGLADEVDTMTHSSVRSMIPELSQIDRLIRMGEIIPAYQPIVSLQNQKVVGYEVLARSGLKGLETPEPMFRVAAQLNMQSKLSGVCRWKGVMESLPLPGTPNLFLNIHPDEDLMTDVLDSLKTIRKSFPHKPLTIEIHEAAIPEPSQMKKFRKHLNALKVELAYDDFGIGQSRLVDLVRIPPDVLKYDISLIRDLDRASDRHVKWLTTLLKTTQEMGIRALAEGVETAGEANVCREMGFELAQGFLFGRARPAKTIADAFPFSQKKRRKK